MTLPEGAVLLVVDDDDVYRERLIRAFRRRRWEAHGAPNAEAALEIAREVDPAYAIVDLRMPGGSGLDLVRSLKELRPTMNVVVVTGYGSIATAVEAVRRGATDFVPKPADLEDLLLAFTKSSAPEARPLLAHEPPSLARTEWEHIQRVLADCGGNISRAARALGIPRKSLQRKLAKYPVPR